MIKPYFLSEQKDFFLLQGDCVDLLKKFQRQFDMIFADPPYFLSNDGLTIKNGKISSVNKGRWDKGISFSDKNKFNLQWLSLIRNIMKEGATIWISGTAHNIFSIGQCLEELGFKILNVITWQKTNPPPNFSCRYFTHSTEFIIWARKNKKIPHYYNYELMKEHNNDKQMRDVWLLPAIQRWEKKFGKHPTQKPLALLARIILASTKENDWILDPFCGSATTGIASNLYQRNFVGIDIEKEYLELSKSRFIDISQNDNSSEYKMKINRLIDFKSL
ncbi:MAG: DNA-methyltransferase [Alphaproteobacteria bacterium]